MPLTVLRAAGNKVADLTPLLGMQLTYLELDLALVTDISPLKGMPLKHLTLESVPATNLHLIATLRELDILSLNGTKPADWDFLKGLNLKELMLGNTQIKDLGVLTGMPLEKLYLNGTRITDLSPLRGLPLRMLTLEKCPNPLDLSPLAECAKLEILVISVNAKNLDPLRQLPNLKRIGYSLLTIYDWGRVTPAADFWKAYDARKRPGRTN
jgi:Leucine-rich repeat (LRR) protein